MGTLLPAQGPAAPDAGRAAGELRRRPSAGLVVHSCAALAGEIVVNRDDAPLGRLEHLMLDVARGRVAYAVLARGGVFGLGERLVAVPWAAMRLDTQRKRFVIDIAPQDLDQAHGFDKDHWPAMSAADWAERVHRFFGVQPYWRAGGKSPPTKAVSRV